MSLFGSMAGMSVAAEAAADRAATRASSAASARDAQREVRGLEDRLGRLTLVCMALWELLKERGELTEEDLATKVREIDLRDGVADGKITRQIKHCPSCDRVMSPRHQKCMYCGAVDLRVTPFDAAM